MFTHPESGEVLESQEAFLKSLSEIEERLAPLYRVRRAIREQYAEKYEPVLPQARYRSQTQEKVARCPRCGAYPEQEVL